MDLEQTKFFIVPVVLHSFSINLTQWETCASCSTRMVLESRSTPTMLSASLKFWTGTAMRGMRVRTGTDLCSRAESICWLWVCMIIGVDFIIQVLADSSSLIRLVLVVTQ